MILITTIRSFRTISTKSALILSYSQPIEMRAQKLAIISTLKRKEHFTTGTITHQIIEKSSIISNIKIDDNELQLSSVLTALKKYFDNKWGEEWTNHTSSTVTKSFFPEISSTKLLRNIQLPHEMVQILSGHSKLNTFLYKIKVVDDPSCECKTSAVS